MQTIAQLKKRADKRELVIMEDWDAGEGYFAVAEKADGFIISPEKTTLADIEKQFDFWDKKDELERLIKWHKLCGIPAIPIGGTTFAILR